MGPLSKIYATQRAARACSDKGTVHSYIEVYEEILSPHRETAKRVLEIGIFKGHSLRMWEAYFIQAEVFGVDICDQPVGGMADLRPMIAEGTHKIFLLDATNAAEIEARFRDLEFDVIIDDASHAISQQLEIYVNLKPHLASGGLYVIEDIDNIDVTRPQLEALDPSVQILDRRKIRNRFDDVLVLIRPTR